MKILLTNSYAVNNGDMALVLALYNELKKRTYEVNIATFYYDFLKTQYPELPLTRELLDYKIRFGGTFVKKIFLRLNFLFNRKYKDHDVFIGSPGGYMNSYYSLKRCLLPLVHAKKLNKKTAVYSQSVGPLNVRDRRLFSKYSKSIDVLMVRDDYSRACVESIECHSKVLQSKDAAFLLPPRMSRATPDVKRVAVSVREWKHDNRKMEDFYGLVVSLCEIVLQNGFEIEFISTCQGVENYRDDSKVAEVIKGMILRKHPAYERCVVVDHKFHTYHELTDLLNSRYAFTIGTRLHMCILSLINGTPAFNISYEVKGIECYKYLGLAEYSSDFNESNEIGLKKFSAFMGNHKQIAVALPKIIGPVHEESKLALDKFLKELGI